MEKNLHDGLGLGGPVGLAHPGLGLGGPPTVPYSAPSQRGGGKTGLRTGGSFQGLLFAVKWETCFSLIPAGQRHEAGEDAKKTRNCKLASVNAGKLNY